MTQKTTHQEAILRAARALLHYEFSKHEWDYPPEHYSDEMLEQHGLVAKASAAILGYQADSITPNGCIVFKSLKDPNAQAQESQDR